MVGDGDRFYMVAPVLSYLASWHMIFFVSLSTLWSCFGFESITFVLSEITVRSERLRVVAVLPLRSLDSSPLARRYVQ